MFYKIFISKKEIAQINIIVQKPFDVTPEKITQNPRSFTSSEIKNGTENILLKNIEVLENDFIKSSLNFILKDLFIYMHQTGLYNRQLKFWKTFGSISKIKIFELYKGFFNNKKKTGIFLIEFVSQAGSLSSVALLVAPNSTKDGIESNINMALSLENNKNLKGITYVTSKTVDQEILSKLEKLTRGTDYILKYESKIAWTKDVRLNIINYSLNENSSYSFKHSYPQIELSKNSRTVSV